MIKGLLAGTFDPPTLGHLDVIERGARLCDKLIVGIASNPDKKNGGHFSEDERLAMVKDMTAGIANVEVVLIPGLVVEVAKELKVDFLLRGLRSFSDFSYEQELAVTNQKIGGMETLFLMGDQRFSQMSSTLIRELASKGERLGECVPLCLEERVFKHFQKR